MNRAQRWLGIVGILVAGAAMAAPATDSAAANYDSLVKLFIEWREFEHPAVKDQVADYSSAAMAAKAAALPQWRARLKAIDTGGWNAQQLNDYQLVGAEIEGLDFNLRVLRPWARDPTFYAIVIAERSDVPLREGPIAWPAIELYNYHFPLDTAAQAELKSRIDAIPAQLEAAKVNLQASTARDLWVFGEQAFRDQSQTLTDLADGRLSVSTLGERHIADFSNASATLRASVLAARQATDEFVRWLEKLAPGKTGPSGVGKENYTWYEQHVHFVPYTWEEQVVLLRRELERAQSALRLEEQRNRNLPQLGPAPDAAAFERLSHQRLDKYVAFLVRNQIIPDKPYLKDALEPELGQFLPEDKRHFFTRMTHREPMLLLAHDYHWFDLARMRDEPHASPIRRLASLSNIWDSRAEGFATAFEEIVMHAGLYDDNPRARELVWIMLANRAARGLASLYVQANEITLEEAGRFHAEWTPRGMAKSGDQLTAFEQLLYLRQPGYGTSYVCGKLLTDRLIAEYAHAQELDGKNFVLRDFMDRFNGLGMIPVSMMESELVPAAARLRW